MFKNLKQDWKSLCLALLGGLLTCVILGVISSNHKDHKDNLYKEYTQCVSKPISRNMFDQLSDGGIALLFTNTVCD